jgi:hypothetical protein
MKRFLFFICAIFLFGTLPTAAALKGELESKDFDLSLFNVSGQRTHRIRAATVSGLSLLKLKDGVVEFFGGEGIKMGTLRFADATFDQAANVIESDTPMQFESDQGTLSSVGFRHEMRTGRLFLKSAVTMKLPDAHIAGHEGEVFLTQDGPTRDLLIARAEIRRAVTVTEIKSEKAKFDRIETDWVLYTGSAGLLEIGIPATGWSDGVLKKIENGKLVFRLEQPLPPLRRSSVSPNAGSTK